MAMSYDEAIAYLTSLEVFGIQPGLERMEALLDRLGHPERAYRTVHVTGTNGKGSTTAFLHEIMHCSGIRVGRFTSPHLEAYTERIRVGHADILPEVFAVRIASVRAAVDDMVEAGLDSPTTFEVLTAAAFLHFKEEAVDYAIIEVGLGGTFDSTNVITPVVSVITNVSLDHTAYCGDTVDAIATHKAGIIKRGVPVVTAALGSPRKVIQKVAHKQGARLYVYDRDFAVSARRVLPEGQFLTVSWRAEFAPVMLVTRMSGVHQAVNLACAVTAARLIMRTDARITEDALRVGCAETHWPGRFEMMRQGKRILIFDGAHNAGGAEAFAATYAEVWGTRPKTVIMGVLEDKNAAALIGHCVQPDDRVITVAPPSPRAVDPVRLARSMPCTATPATSMEEALSLAFSDMPEDGILVVCGSLYLLGPAKSMIRDRFADA